MIPGLVDGTFLGRMTRWQKNLLARYNRHVASLPSVPDEGKEEHYQEALQYQAVMQALQAIRKGVEPIWDNREELEYYLEWELDDPLYEESTP